MLSAVLLTSADGATVELRPARYQYPNQVASGERDWDANWLLIDGAVRAGDGEAWSFTDPCLTTWEARALTSWLRAAAEGDVEPSAAPADEGSLLVFTEPNIAWSVAAFAVGTVVLRVHLALESAPPSTAGKDTAIWDYFVPLALTSEALLAAADTWDAELRPFPVR